MAVFFVFNLTLGSLCLLHLLLYLHYELRVLKHQLRIFAYLQIAGILSSCVLFFTSTVYHINGEDDMPYVQVIWSVANVMSTVQLSAYAVFLYMRSLPIINLFNPAYSKVLKASIVVIVSLLLISCTVKVIKNSGLNYAWLTTAGDYGFTVSGSLILLADIFYLSIYLRSWSQIRMSREFQIISKFCTLIIIFNFCILAFYIMFLTEVENKVTRETWSLCYTTLAWLVFVLLTIMKIRLENLNNVTISSLKKTAQGKSWVEIDQRNL